MRHSPRCFRPAVVAFLILEVAVANKHCHDKESSVESFTGHTCEEIKERAGADYCREQLCPTCIYAGYCDLTCGFCSTPAPSPDPTQRPAPRPTTKPTYHPSPMPTSTVLSSSSIGSSWKPKGLLQLGCFFIAFSPPLALTVGFLGKHPTLLAISLGGVVFWLLSVLFAAAAWAALPSSFRDRPPVAMVLGTAAQEASRYALLATYRGFERTVVAAREVHDRRSRERRRCPPQGQTGSSSSGSFDGPQEAQSNWEDSRSAAATPTNPRTCRQTASGRLDGGGDKYAAGVKLPVWDHSSALAAGVGFGAMHSLVMFGGVLFSSLDLGAALFVDSCPNVPFLLTSATFSLAFFILDVVWMCVAFFAERTDGNPWRSKAWGFVVATHFLTAAAATLPSSCLISMPAVFVCLVGTVSAARLVFPGHSPFGLPVR
mmetsp:Transcript_48684/g.96391  ORF Transcript_48684/g.96391 Transcript_48684/m.96391 type:complete len:430 (-) Transcript_48684:248-1537(-)|eukprot:CAMPEP_0171968480 /NCGR_PEP_ID=MMETSP0993-20121228/203470_1 /TAXON_ID=483369 /ORGANISM="non described non described, Strain CCMP2098" /LENGTH=429 /DNA_ID=CAMNT_0012618207 /DNA_START=46 /DNA_END=1335 /DNA_ORIENTATION=+